MWHYVSTVGQTMDLLGFCHLYRDIKAAAGKMWELVKYQKAGVNANMHYAVWVINCIGFQVSLLHFNLLQSAVYAWKPTHFITEFSFPLLLYLVCMMPFGLL